jgi:hypothetical protein
MADYTGMLGMLEASIRPDTKDKVPEAAERELANLARLLEQTKKSDARGAEETLRQLEQDNDLLAQHGRGRAARDPSAKSLRVRCRSLFISFLFFPISSFFLSWVLTRMVFSCAGGGERSREPDGARARLRQGRPQYPQ